MRQLDQQMTVSGNSPHTLHYPEAAAQNFEVGEPVVLNVGAGTIQRAATPAASVLGVAAANASGVTGRMCPVWIANDDTLFAINMPTATAAVLGTLVQVTLTAGKWSAVVGAGGTFLVMEIGQSLPPGAVIVRGKFIESASQLGKVA